MEEEVLLVDPERSGLGSLRKSIHRIFDEFHQQVVLTLRTIPIYETQEEGSC
jgi:hypothetical protein